MIEVKYAEDSEAIMFFRQIISSFEGLTVSSSAIGADIPPIYGVVVYPQESSDSKTLVAALRGAGINVRIEDHHPLACSEGSNTLCLIVGYKEN
jgi:hypothetical protein